MTKDDIIKMAVESGLAYKSNHYWWMDAGEVGYELERFAALVAAAEREACAKLCENIVSNYGYVQSKWCAEEIRQRGKE